MACLLQSRYSSGGNKVGRVSDFLLGLSMFGGLVQFVVFIYGEHECCFLLSLYLCIVCLCVASLCSCSLYV